MCGEKDGSDIPSFPEMPWYFWVFIYSVMFFVGPFQSIANFWMQHDRNALHRGVPLTNSKKAAVTRDISIPKCK